MNESRQLEELRSRLRALPAVPPPAELGTRLRIVASQEAARRRRWSSPAAILRYAAERTALFVNNLMRPYAVPVTGGLASSVLIFSMILTNYPLTGHIEGDVPTPVSTEPGLVSSFSFSGVAGEDVVVDVDIDEQGRITDYSFPTGQRWASDPESRRKLENTLLYTRFKAATRFFQPVSGRATILIVRSQMDVIG